jgi:hypothetical protein
VFGGAEIKKLQAQERLLIAESAINRRILSLEWQQLKASVSWVKPGRELARSLRPALIVLAPIAGILLVRSWRSARGLWFKALLLWQVGKRVRNAWQLVKGRSKAR